MKRTYIQYLFSAIAIVLLTACSGSGFPYSWDETPEPPAPTPTLSVSPQSLSFNDVAGASRSVTVSANIEWSATSNQSWCTVSPDRGNGNGTLTITVSENTGTESRTATVTVSGDGVQPQTISVTQRGVAAPVPSLSVNTDRLSFSAAASQQTADVTANVHWTANSDQPWCTVSPASGNNNGTLTIAVLANTSVDTRTATITINGEGIESKTISVTQAGAAPTLTVNPGSHNMAATGGECTFNVESNTTWNVSKNDNWITLRSNSGSNNGAFTVAVAENATTDSRTATITVTAGGLTRNVTVTQAGATPASYGRFIYFVGSTDGWATFDQRLESDYENGRYTGLYTGFVYLADPSNWGLEFKFTADKGNWDAQINSTHFTTFSGDVAAGSDTNLKGTAGDGVYYIVLDRPAQTITATKIQYMNVVGDFCGWDLTDSRYRMTWDATNQCYVINSIQVTSNGWKFVANGNWNIGLGTADGTTNRLTINGDNLTQSGTVVKLYPTRVNSDNIYCTVETRSPDPNDNPTPGNPARRRLPSRGSTAR